MKPRLSQLAGLIERRILVNYRADPAVVREFLPDPFEPQLVNGASVVGVCLIRLRHVRPAGLPQAFGLTSENVAHRIAVTMPGTRDLPSCGVYIPRRDTSSRLVVAASRRFVSGGLHLARFTVCEEGANHRVEVSGPDGEQLIVVDGTEADALPTRSVFSSLEDASRFFQRGSLGYSDGACAGVYDGVQLSTTSWSIRPLQMREVRSSFFEDTTVFPAGSVTFDSALLMTGIESSWSALAQIRGIRAA